MITLMLASLLLVICIAIRARLDIATAAVLVSTHLNMSGPSFDAQGQLGYLNMLRILVPAVILSYRCGILSTRWSSAAWMLFAFMLLLIGHVPNTQFLLPLVKLLAYLGIYGLLCYSLYRLCQAQLHKTKAFAFIVVICPLVLAFIQTGLYGGVYGTADGRFTSFTSPQDFALFYVGVLGYLLVSGPRGASSIFLVSLCFVSIFMSGSRAPMLVSILMLVMWAFLQAFKSSLNTLVGGLVLLLTGIGSGLWLYAYPTLLGSNRATEAILAITTGNDTFGDFGTYTYRANVSNEATNRVLSGDVVEVLLGHGYGASAMASISAGARTTMEAIDPNRALHNEYLRVLLDTGLIGFVLVFGSFALFTYKVFRSSASPFMILIPALPVLVALGLENLLVGSGTASGWGLILGLTALLGIGTLDTAACSSCESFEHRKAQV